MFTEKYSSFAQSPDDDKPKGDMLTRMTILKKAQEIYSLLPEFDCGACGSPNCIAFARDVAEGNANLSDCVVLDKKKKQNTEDKNDG